MERTEVKAVKIPRPKKKCPKCGYRKRVDLRYMSGMTVALPAPFLSGHSASMTLDSVALVCPICGYRHCVVDPLDRVLNKEKIRLCCEGCPEHKKGCIGVMGDCSQPMRLGKAFGFDMEEVMASLKAEEEKDGNS